MDRNPCLGCDLKNQDKNNPACMECDARCEYVHGLGGMTHSLPVEMTDLVAHRKKETPRLTAGRGLGLNSEDIAWAIEGGYMRETNNAEHEINDAMEKICSEEGVTFSALQDKGRGKVFSRARLRIAYRLINDFGISQEGVGAYTGVSGQAISHLLKKDKKGKAPGFAKASQGLPGTASATQGLEGKTAEPKPEKTTDAVDILHKRYIGDDPERKASLQAEREKTEAEHEKTVTIDFSEHAEALEQLEKYAKIEIRSVPDQILYFIINSLGWEPTGSEIYEKPIVTED